MLFREKENNTVENRIYMKELHKYLRRALQALGRAVQRPWGRVGAGGWGACWEGFRDGRKAEVFVIKAS